MSTFKQLLVACILAFALAAPAAAQTAAECRDQFLGADLNNDGVLSAAEIGNSADLPDGVTPGMTLQQFVAECQQ